MAKNKKRSNRQTEKMNLAKNASTLHKSENALTFLSREVPNLRPGKILHRRELTRDEGACILSHIFFASYCDWLICRTVIYLSLLLFFSTVRTACWHLSSACCQNTDMMKRLVVCVCCAAAAQKKAILLRKHGNRFLDPASGPFASLKIDNINEIIDHWKDIRCAIWCPCLLLQLGSFQVLCPHRRGVHRKVDVVREIVWNL